MCSGGCMGSRDAQHSDSRSNGPRRNSSPTCYKAIQHQEEQQPMSKTDRNKQTNDPRSKPQETRSVSSSDPSLVAMAMRGDVTAFELLAMRYRRRIHSLALRITGNFHDAEDIVQQVFLKAFVNLNNYRGAAQFSTWLSRIAI